MSRVNEEKNSAIPTNKTADELTAAPCCDDWEPQIAKVNAPIILQAARSGVNFYDGKAFVFCPWCGRRRYPNITEARRRAREAWLRENGVDG